MSSQRLGILDWGIGGVGIYKLIKHRSPETSVIYFSDTGVTPYGRMSRSELVARLNSVIAYLKRREVTHLLIGCNAASTAIPFLDTQGLKVIGVIETAVEIAAKAKPKRLGLIGGRRTVLSGVYRRAFAERGIRVQQRIAQPLSALIEGGDVSSDHLREECSRIFRPLSDCSHILLACTHYPAIADVLREFVEPQTHFIDPAAALASQVARWRVMSAESDAFLTSGDPAAMRTAARNAFGVKIGKVKPVDL